MPFIGGSKDDTPIRKFQCISSTRPWLVYTGGSRSVPDGSKDSQLVSSFTLPDNDMPILPFNDELLIFCAFHVREQVIEFILLLLSVVEEESPVIAVLTKSELVMINLNDEKAKEIECGSTKIKRSISLISHNTILFQFGATQIPSFHKFSWVSSLYLSSHFSSTLWKLFKRAV